MSCIMIMDKCISHGENVTEDAKNCNINQMDEFNGHPSFKKLVDDGYTIITF